MGDNSMNQVQLTKRPHCSYSKLTMKKETAMNLEDTIIVCLRIINNILAYTSTLETQETFFDYCSKQDNTETDSDSSDRDIEDNSSSNDIEPYIVNTINYLGLDKSLLILSMMIFDKLLQMNPQFVFSERNAQKVMFLCLMETQKFYDDESFTNKDYARVGNIEVNELLLLEIEFLNMIQYDLNIKDEAFAVYSSKLTKFWEVI